MILCRLYIQFISKKPFTIISRLVVTCKLLLTLILYSINQPLISTVSLDPGEHSATFIRLQTIQIYRRSYLKESFYAVAKLSPFPLLLLHQTILQSLSTLHPME